MKKKITRNGMFKKWIKALRSGKYEQGRNQLKTKATASFGPKHCCLGVLCEIAKEEGIINTYKGNDGGIPGTLAKFMDIRPMGEFKRTVKGNDSLAYLNDEPNSKGHGSFKFIASLLEKRPHVLKSYKGK